MRTFFKTILILGAIFSSNSSFAADFVISKELPKTNDMKVGDEVLVNIGFLAEGVNYNAFEGELLVSDNFEIIKTVTGNSFVTVWLENPADFIPGAIRFSGITPAGYNKETGLLFSAVLKVEAPGTGEISLTDVSAYENDGLGTKTNLPDSVLRLSVRPLAEGEEPYRIAVQDLTPPEPFALELVRDPNLYDGRYALVWNALDKGSGVAGYDLVIGYSVFKQVESPYVLEKGKPHGKMKVIAYDHEGNTRTATLAPPGTVCVAGSCVGIVETAALFVIIGLVMIWRKRKR